MLPPESIGAECVIHEAVFAIHLIGRLLVMEIVRRRRWKEEEDVRDLVAAVLVEGNGNGVGHPSEGNGHMRLQNQWTLLENSRR